MPTSAYVLGPLVVLLTALFAVAYFVVPLYWAYKITDAYQRADAVRREAARLRVDLRDAERPPGAVPADAIRADAYRDCLRATPIHKLKSYAGVGDVTVQRLDEVVPDAARRRRPADAADVPCAGHRPEPRDRDRQRRPRGVAAPA